MKKKKADAAEQRGEEDARRDGTKGLSRRARALASLISEKGGRGKARARARQAALIERGNGQGWAGGGSRAEAEISSSSWQQCWESWTRGMDSTRAVAGVVDGWAGKAGLRPATRRTRRWERRKDSQDI